MNQIGSISRKEFTITYTDACPSELIHNTAPNSGASMQRRQKRGVLVSLAKLEKARVPCPQARAAYSRQSGTLRRLKLF